MEMTQTKDQIFYCSLLSDECFFFCLIAVFAYKEHNNHAPCPMPIDNAQQSNNNKNEYVKLSLNQF